MKNKREKGFVLILVVMAMALIAAQMAVMASIGKTSVFESGTAHLGAVERNLTASGLAWAKINAATHDEKKLELDVSGMGVRDSALTVIIETAGDDRAEVEISTTCRRGRREVNKSGKYNLRL